MYVIPCALTEPEPLLHCLRCRDAEAHAEESHQEHAAIAMTIVQEAAVKRCTHAWCFPPEPGSVSNFLELTDMCGVRQPREHRASDMSSSPCITLGNRCIVCGVRLEGQEKLISGVMWEGQKRCSQLGYRCDRVSAAQVHVGNRMFAWCRGFVGISCLTRALWY